MIQAHDDAQCVEETRRADRVRSSYVALSLTDLLGRRIFSSPDGLDDLDDTEARVLVGEVWRALGRIGPVLGHVDVAAWHTALCEGARAPRNGTAVFALGQCYDASYSRPVDRPDRYWGVPLCQLTGGHWLAYKAARALYEERQPKG